jgi:hypothetical protein
MAYINASTAVNRVKLIIIKASDATVTNGEITPVEDDFYTAVSNTTGEITTADATAIVVPGLQDVTINNANGSFRWKQLDEGGEKVITTNATNNLSGNFVLDPTAFFGSSGATGAKLDGIFKLSNDRTPVAFLIAPEGVTTGKKLLMGTGFISALAPTVSADSPVFVSPITIEVNGDYILATGANGA